MSTKMRGSSEGASARCPQPSTPEEREGQAGIIDRRASTSHGFNPARLALHGASAVGSVANRGLVTAAIYMRRTAIAKAAAATILEMGRFTSDRTRQLMDSAALRLAKGAQRPPLPEDGWYQVGRRLCSISAYELQLIDDKIRDAGIIEYADLLGVKDPTELIKVAELRREAIKGDEEAQFELARCFCAPPFRKRKSCARCGHSFGVTRYRHHCRHCGESFCEEHSPFRHPIPKIGHLTPARVCHKCKTQLEEEDLKDRIVWRMARLEALLQGRLIPYFEPAEDSRLERARRCVEGAINMARSVPLRTTAALAGEALDLLRKYGLSGMAGVLLRSECIEAIELLNKVSGVDQAWPMSAHQLSAGMYFLLAKHRAERGAYPDLEREAAQCCGPVDEKLLQDMLRLAPLALHFAYCATPVEMQCRARQQDWDLVFCQHQSTPGQPAFAIFCNQQKKEASVVVRGTADIGDLAMEIRALPLPFPQALTSSGEREEWTSVSGTTERLASSGLGGAAQWLFTETYPHLRRLLDEGYSINLLGHSLGGAVAALLGVLLREEGITTGIKCYTFGSPACVNGPLAKVCETFATAVVLHDDVIPRITPDSIRDLLRDLLQERESVVQLWKDDLEAIIVKAKGLWAPRWRRVDVARAAASQDSSSRQAGKGDGRAGEGSAASPTQGGAAEYDPFSGWDSADDDFEDYFGIGCTRDVAPRGEGPVSRPDCYSIRLSDGSTTTVDIGAARRRLLGEDYAANTTTTTTTTGGAMSQRAKEEEQRSPRPHEEVESEDGFGKRGGDEDEEGEGESLGGSQSSHSRSSASSCARSSASSLSPHARRRTSPASSNASPASTSSSSNREEEEEEEEEETSPRGDEEGEEEKSLGTLFPGLADDDEDEEGRGPTSRHLNGYAVGTQDDESAAASPRSPATHAPPPASPLSSVEEGRRLGSGGYKMVVEQEEGDRDGMCVVEDVQLPDMYLPGRVVHLYSDRGVYRAGMPTRDFKGLRRIVMAGHMLRDHEAKAYFEALVEVLDVRKAFQDPPAWQSFDEAKSCNCCGTRLETPLAPAPTGSEGHKGRHKHNCRCCGLVVCQTCSEHRRALPTIGLAQAVRVCNRCFFGGKQHTDAPAMPEAAAGVRGGP